jgi:hypothetical protein
MLVQEFGLADRQCRSHQRDDSRIASLWTVLASKTPSTTMTERAFVATPEAG